MYMYNFKFCVQKVSLPMNVNRQYIMSAGPKHSVAI